MIYVKRFLLLLIIALMLTFAFQNQDHLGQRLELTFLRWHQSLVLGFWLLFSFIAGASLFLLIDLPRAFSLKRDLRRKSEELARAQFEISRLQPSPTEAPTRSLPTLQPTEGSAQPFAALTEGARAPQRPPMPPMPPDDLIKRLTQ